MDGGVATATIIPRKVLSTDALRIRLQSRRHLRVVPSEPDPDPPGDTSNPMLADHGHAAAVCQTPLKKRAVGISLTARDPWRAIKNAPMPDDGLIGWMHRHCHQNYWRVVGLMEMDDLIQEGYVCYCYCRNLYGVGLPPQQFMALYKRAFDTRLTDFSKARTNKRAHEVIESDLYLPGEEDTSESPLERLINAEDSSDLSGILEIISEAPTQPIRDFLTLFLTDAAEQLREPFRRKIGIGRETTNQFICRILGVNPLKVGDLVADTKAYLRGSLKGVALAK